MSIINNFFNSLNDPQAALWSAGVAFNRSNPLPLDKWSVFSSKDEAINYAETNAVAYPGQIIAVFDNSTMQAYILAEDEDNSKLILSPIGVIPTGSGPISISDDGVISLGTDGITIEVIDGKLTLLGFQDAAIGAKLTKTENGLAWIDENNSVVNFDELNEKIESIQAAVGQPSTEDEDGNLIPASGIYADLESLNTTKANKNEVYTKTETESVIDTKIAAIDHLKRKVVVGIESIDLNAYDADQYIYMIPNSKGNYDEYMVIDQELEKVGDWEVNLDTYATKEDIERLEENDSNLTEKIETVEEQLKDKVDIVYYTVETDSGETSQVPGTLLTPEDREKLDSLVFGDDGGLEISNKVNAYNVEGLGTWVAREGNTYIQNLSESNLTPELSSKLNFINSVDEEHFSVDFSELKLNDSILNTINSKAEKEEIKTLEDSITELQNTVNGYVDENDQEVFGLTDYVAKLNTKVGNLETVMNSLEDTYVLKTTFTTTVGNLNDLISQNQNNIANLTGRVDLLETYLSWGELAQEQEENN